MRASRARDSITGWRRFLSYAWRSGERVVACEERPPCRSIRTLLIWPHMTTTAAINASSRMNAKMTFFMAETLLPRAGRCQFGHPVKQDAAILDDEPATTGSRDPRPIAGHPRGRIAIDYQQIGSHSLFQTADFRPTSERGGGVARRRDERLYRRQTGCNQQLQLAMHVEARCHEIGRCVGAGQHPAAGLMKSARQPLEPLESVAPVGNFLWRHRVCIGIGDLR